MVVPAEQWALMGELVIRSFGELKHANGATDPITVSVMAWAEDVHLSVPTSNQPALLSPQAGPDEYNGVISKPANVVSKMAASMANVPQIGKYAVATSTMASAIAKVAGMYGYSKPKELVQINSSPFTFPESSNVEGTDITHKLSLDPKQETSIDPTIMGLGPTDEMTILSMATRESYLTSFNWTTTQTPEAKIFGTAVSPVLWGQNVDPLTGQTELHMPACCFATMPFRHWRGSMKFRFQVVCSAFHKGRLRVVYDPSSQLTSEYNVNYNYIVDISNENDFTVQVGWGSNRTLLQHGSPGQQLPPYGPTYNDSPGYNHNGVLSVYIMNELTTPNSIVNNDVQVNVFVSACDDFRVFNPSVQWIDNYLYFESNAPAARSMASIAMLDEEDHSIRYYRPLPKEKVDPVLGDEKIDPIPEEDNEGKSEVLMPQAGLDHPDEHHTDDQDAPVQDKVTTLANISTSPSVDAVYQGDPIMSFRQCLKRYNYHSSLLMETSSRRWHKFTLPNFPMYRGYAPGAIYFTSGPNYNYTKNTLMNYLTPAYVCRRGSLRWRYHRDRGTNASTGDIAIVQRLPFSTNGYNYTQTAALEPNASRGSRALEAVTQIPSTWPGFSASDTWTQPILSIDLPYCVPVRFSLARSANVNVGTDNILHNMFHQYTTRNTTVGAGILSPRIDAYVAAGDDYTLGMFIGAPRMYFRAIGADPTPS
jgi:hypothetical protein